MSLKKLPLLLGIGLTASAVVIVILVSRLAQPPMFTVTNLSGESVSVRAIWRDTSKDLGMLAADEKLQFNVVDEAAMVFSANTADGRSLTSREIYFTRGVGIFAEITDSDIRVRYVRDE